MATPIEYAQLSSRVYDASLNRNRTFIPSNWTELNWSPDDGVTGFSAGVYRKGNEIVISYTGTNDKSLDWLFGNIAATGLLPAPQVFAAMRLYLDVKRANPGTSISFTGHSLGGGLASLMSVFFNKPATVFAQAPFQLTAQNPVVLSALQASLLLNGYLDLDFSLYNASFGTLFLLREGNVSNTYIDGEILRSLVLLPEIAGTSEPLLLGQSTAGKIDRHSMLLHEAAVYSRSFLVAAQKLPHLVSLLLDPNLYGVADRRDPNKTDILSMILRHQFGDGASFASDGMLEGFVRDLTQLARGGLINAAPGLEDLLIKATLQGYYALQDSRFARDLFTGVGGGFYLDTNRIVYLGQSIVSSTEIQSALSAYYGPEPFTAGIDSYDRWYFQDGAGGMNATAEGSHNNLLAGGLSADQLTGGSRGDLLLGGASSDTLDGGRDTTADLIYGGTGDDFLVATGGDDRLFGGQGNDTYVIKASAGNAQIQDDDRQGHIVYKSGGISQTLTLGNHKSTDPAGTYQSPDGTIIYQVNGADLTITTPTNTITVRNFNQANKDFGIRLIDLPAEPTEDTATGPNNFWGVAPPNAAVSSTKTITTTTVSKNGVTTTTRSPDPLPPSVTDTEILFKSEQISNTTVTTGQGTPETTDDTSTTVIVDNWYYRNAQAQMIDESAGRPSLACGPRLDPIGDDGDHSFSADAVTTLMDGRGGDDTINGRGVNGITLLGGAGNDSLYNGYTIRGGDGNDFIDGYGGPGFYYGEAGNDFIYYYYADPAGNSVADGG